MWEVRLQGKDRSDGHGCPNAADAGMRRSGPTIRLHFHHCTWTCRCREAQDVRERPSLAVRRRKIRLQGRRTTARMQEVEQRGERLPR